MGYFANGSEGMEYESKYCENCINYFREDVCPILDLHLIYNYDDCNDKYSKLHYFIPRDKQGKNNQCIMFYNLDDVKRDLGGSN